MKIRQLSLLLSLLLLNLFFLQPALAGPCTGIPNYVHCAYLSGLDHHSARYIKIYYPQYNYSSTSCTSDTGAYFVSQTSASHNMGTRTQTYYICSDALGAQCELLGSDTYTIFKSGSSYSSEPKLYTINVSAVKNKYPSC